MVNGVDVFYCSHRQSTAVSFSAGWLVDVMACSFDRTAMWALSCTLYLPHTNFFLKTKFKEEEDKNAAAFTADTAMHPHSQHPICASTDMCRIGFAHSPKLSHPFLFSKRMSSFSLFLLMLLLFSLLFLSSPPFKSQRTHFPSPLNRNVLQGGNDLSSLLEEEGPVIFADGCEAWCVPRSLSVTATINEIEV